MIRRKISDEDVGIIVKRYYESIGRDVAKVEFEGSVHINFNESEEVQTKFRHHKYGVYHISEIPKGNGKCNVTFEDTGYTYKTWKKDAIRGKVLDRFYKSILNVGYLGGTEYKPSMHKNAYSSWTNMLNRCYNKENFQYPDYGGKGVRVADEWHNFQNFGSWFVRYYEEGFEVDKDLLATSEQLIYSKENCILIPKRLNLLIRDITNIFNGVSWDKENSKYVACCSDGNGVSMHLGRFKDEKKAREVYIKTKVKILKDSLVELLETQEISEDKLKIINKHIDVFESNYWESYNERGLRF